MLNIKNFFLENNIEEKNKKITNNQNVFFLGGLIFILAIFFTSISLTFKLFCFFIYFLGLLSDKKFLFSPNLRLVLQFILIFSAINFLDIRVIETRVEILDNFLNHKLISILFTVFCLLILINGSNFIDGTNCNLLFYYAIINLIIILLSFSNDQLLINNKDLIIILFVIIIALIFNYFGKIISGDGGAYLIGFFFGIIFIFFSTKNYSISPFFIVLLLWYPAFENLFSILRKLKIQKSALEADFKHFHQLLYLYLNRSLKNKLMSNNLSGIIINVYNLIIFLVSIKFYHHTQTMIMLILLNIVVYLFAYFKLMVFLKK